MFNVDHVALNVSNMKEAVEFYSMFGFVEYKSWKAEDGSVEIRRFKLNNRILELFYDATITEVGRPSIGYKHFAFGVSDINQAREFMVENNVTFATEIREGRLGKPYFFIIGPDNVSIEVIEEGD